MTRDIHKTYATDESFMADGKLVMAIHAEGKALVENVTAHGANFPKAVAIYLERHAQIFGSKAVAEARLRFYTELKDLPIEEIVRRLVIFVEATFAVAIGNTAREDRLSALWSR